MFTLSGGRSCREEENVIEVRGARALGPLKHSGASPPKRHPSSPHSLPSRNSLSIFCTTPLSPAHSPAQLSAQPPPALTPSRPRRSTSPPHDPPRRPHAQHGRDRAAPPRLGGPGDPDPVILRAWCEGRDGTERGLGLGLHAGAAPRPLLARDVPDGGDRMAGRWTGILDMVSPYSLLRLTGGWCASIERAPVARRV